jgi:hypothetical protein
MCKIQNGTKQYETTYETHSEQAVNAWHCEKEFITG